MIGFKKNFLSCFFFMLIIHGFSQDVRHDFLRKFSHDTLKIPKARLNLLKTNPLAIFFSQVIAGDTHIIIPTGEFRVMYELVELPKQSSVIALSYVMMSPFWADSVRLYYKPMGVKLQINGVRIQVAQKFYISKWNSPEGFYVAPHASYNWTKWAFNWITPVSSGQNAATFFVNYINFNALFGFQKLIRKKIAFDVNTGIGFRYNFYREKDSQTIVPIKIGEGSRIPYWFKLSFTNNFGFIF